MEELLYVSVVALGGMLVYQNVGIRSILKRLLASRSVVSGAAELRSAMELEFERARRLNYPFSIAVINIADGIVWNAAPDAVLRILADGDPARVSADMPPGTVNLFRSGSNLAVKLRATDTAVYDEKNNRFILLLIGTHKHDAERIAAQITERLSQGLEQDVNYGCAEFPSDALFLDDLIAVAETGSVATTNDELGPNGRSESLAS